MATEHAALAEALRAAVSSGQSETLPERLREVAGRAAGGAAIMEPFDELARQIGEAAYRVTDTQMAAVRAAVDSDRAAFEIVMAAAIGAGLMRWDRAQRGLEEIADAAR